MEIESDVVAEPRQFLEPTTHLRRVKVIGPPDFTARALVSGLVSLSAYKDLLAALSVHRLQVRYKQSMLGIAWAIVQPLALMIIYTLVFSLFARVRTPGVPYPVFAYAALLPWTFFSTGLTNATNGLVSNTQLVTKVYFPREILPLSYIVAALADFAIASLIMVCLMGYYHVPLTSSVLWTVPIVIVLTLFLTAISLVLSALQVRFRDVAMGMPLLLQLWMFASPVVYPLEQVPVHFRSVYLLNPMAGIIENFRAALLGTPLDVHSMIIATAATFILLPAAYLYFKHVESTIADVI